MTTKVSSTKTSKKSNTKQLPKHASSTPVGTTAKRGPGRNLVPDSISGKVRQFIIDKPIGTIISKKDLIDFCVDNPEIRHRSFLTIIDIQMKYAVKIGTAIRIHGKGLKRIATPQEVESQEAAALPSDPLLSILKVMTMLEKRLSYIETKLVEGGK